MEHYLIYKYKYFEATEVEQIESEKNRQKFKIIYNNKSNMKPNIIFKEKADKKN